MYLFLYLLTAGIFSINVLCIRVTIYHNVSFMKSRSVCDRFIQTISCRTGTSLFFCRLLIGGEGGVMSAALTVLITYGYW